MKKLFYLALFLPLMLFASCKPDHSPLTKFTYDLTITGDADGIVTVNFPDGSFELNGKAGLYFTYANDTLVVNRFYTMNELFDSSSPTHSLAFSNVNNYLNSHFSVSSAGGTYDIVIRGYIKEPITGIVVAIDRRFTNRENFISGPPSDTVKKR